MTKNEYRVVWKREGYKKKSRTFARLQSAQKYALLFTDRPWEYKGTLAEDYVCCSGDQCSCEGLIWREKFEKDMVQYPKVESCHIEQRQVGVWELTKRK